jgi:hypothetical protein
VDGVATDTLTDSSTILAVSGQDVEIGGSSALGSTATFVGNIDDVRVTNGIARYTTTFTPPVRELPNPTI